MDEYGVTKDGWVTKRLDTIMEEVHKDLTEGFGFNTRIIGTSFLNSLITTFCGQIAEMWEVAQESYYSMFPSTATGKALDYAVQYGGVVRQPAKRSRYTLHCTGQDGTSVREGAVVSTNTSPEVHLYASEEFQITRASFNRAVVKPAIVANGSYSVTLNDTQYAITNSGGTAENICDKLKEAITDESFTIASAEGLLVIEAKSNTASYAMTLSNNLTTESVTSLAVFLTEDYGKITIPNGLITKMIDNIAGFESVVNKIEPTLGSDIETDVELRQDYLEKSNLRSNTMIGSITSELLNSVDGVESASGYENDTDYTDENGLPPHSIEIIVEGGNDADIAKTILRKKAGGIQTYGSVEVDVLGDYEDTIPVRFNRPTRVYAWFKITLHGDSEKIPANYAQLAKEAIINSCAGYTAGDDLLVQILDNSIYEKVAGVTFVDSYIAYTEDSSAIPESGDYKIQNIIVPPRKRIVVDQSRIEVTVDVDT